MHIDWVSASFGGLVGTWATYICCAVCNDKGKRALHVFFYGAAAVGSSILTTFMMR
jgi:hypothetical protein